MTAWFSKLFKGDEAPAEAPAAESVEPERSAAMAAAPSAVAAPRPAAPRPVVRDDNGDGRPKPRRVVEPTVLAEEEQSPVDGNEIRIKARHEKDGNSYIFMVDRPVLEGYSAWFPVPEAAALSPLAQAIFAVDGAASVMIHGMNVTVARDPFQRTDWEAWAREVGGRIREHLKSGQEVVLPEFFSRIPSEEDILDRLQTVINVEINPGIASHSGAIAVERIEGNTVFIRMMGGCQGCAASTITLRQGIHQAFREAVPELGAILDQTDHTAGTNPYYRQLPTEMDDYA